MSWVWKKYFYISGYLVSDRISGFICRVSNWPDNQISNRKNKNLLNKYLELRINKLFFLNLFNM